MVYAPSPYPPLMQRGTAHSDVRSRSQTNPWQKESLGRRFVKAVVRFANGVRKVVTGFRDVLEAGGEIVRVVEEYNTRRAASY